MQDLLAGQIDFMIEPASNFRSLIATGSIKPYGHHRQNAAVFVTGNSDGGRGGAIRIFVATLWYGLWVPKDTPKDIVEKLNATLRQVLADPSVERRFADLGIQISPRDQQSPEALRAFQKAEMERWWPIIKASNVRAQ